jgi:hypothetical protein
MSVDFPSWYENAKAELEKLQGERAELERQLEERESQIAVLKRTVNFLAPLVGEEPAPAVAPEGAGQNAGQSAGMTDSVREILRTSPEPQTASEIRDALERLGFDMKSYSNPLATIHTVLRRLTEADEVQTTHEMMSSGKRYVMPTFKGVSLLRPGSGLSVEKIAGKDFEIGKLKGFIGVGRLRRNGKIDKSKEKR